MRRIDLTGRRFGRLVAIMPLSKKHKKVAYWKCRCDCGNEVEVSSSNLKSGSTKSCGCYQKDMRSLLASTHGLSKTRLHSIWTGMKTRCENNKHLYYHRYGGRGISVCEEWRRDFKTFYDWAMENGYQSDLKLDRKNNDGDYEPGNCRWITQAEQCRNKADNVPLTINGETKLLTDWAREYGINPGTLSLRVSRGIVDDRLLTPCDLRRKEVDLDEIMAMRSAGSTLSEICDKFGICRTTLCKKINEAKVTTG